MSETTTPRRKRFNIRVEETVNVTFTVLAFSVAEAEEMAEEMAEQQSFPPDAREYADREVRVWKGKP